MKWLRLPMLALMVLLMAALPGDTDPFNVVAPVLQLPQRDAEFAFIAWSDQHVGEDGQAEHLLPALEAMRTLPGRAYPAEIGGAAARPEFVFGAGDCIDWPTRQAVASYVRSMSWPGVPHIEILGNHDEGDGSPANPMRRFIVARHGSLSFRFDCGGVSFLNVFSPYSDAQHLTPDSLAWLRSELAKIGPERPVIVSTHLSLAAIRNPDALIDAMGDANVILVLGGHLHRTRMAEYRGRRFVQLPSPKACSEIIVIRIDMDRLLAIPYDYRRDEWLEVLVDASITRGSSATAQD